MPIYPEPMGLAAILQMLCLSRKSAEITFLSQGSSGLVYLLHGRVIHALCGVLEGEQAIYRMLSWPLGEYSLKEDVLPQDTTIAITWEQLLLEGARRTDEGIDKQSPENAKPVVTSAPATSSRVKASLPKITLTLPDQRPWVYELEAEYTHVGRASGNEVPLSDPSVSNRHCIFILHGSDVVVRDLNSSNGTVVNGQPISEVVLRPGDVIQVGVIQMKFEPAVRRPKLTEAAATGVDAESALKKVTNRLPSRTTFKLPQIANREVEAPITRSNSAFVKGESAISYENLPKPEGPSSKGRPWVLIIIAAVIILAALGGAYYYFFLLHSN